jgi:glutamate-1-semialdehyde 2,1-aminomutase
VDPRNQVLIDHVAALGFAWEQGSEQDVLERFVQAADRHGADVVVRITGDCPLVDPQLVDDCILHFLQAEVDYLSNTSPPTYPDGLDVEVVRLGALRYLRRRPMPTLRICPICVGPLMTPKTLR